MVIFAFAGNVSQRVARSLSKHGDVHILDSTKESIDAFIETCVSKKPNKILGLGMYSRVDNNKIRIETLCTNAFKSKPLHKEAKEIPYWFRTRGLLKLASGIGNSYCNYASFKITEELTDTPYTFLHIPKSFDEDLAAKVISRQLNMYK